MAKARKVIYLSGKMRGLPQFGFPLFDQGKKLLQSKGWRVISPADMDRVLGFTPEENQTEDYDFDVAGALRRDFNAILGQCHAIGLLPNWGDSGGAHAELYLAVSVGLPVYYVDLEGSTVDKVDVEVVEWPNFQLTLGEVHA